MKIDTPPLRVLPLFREGVNSFLSSSTETKIMIVAAVIFGILFLANNIYISLKQYLASRNQSLFFPSKKELGDTEKKEEVADAKASISDKGDEESVFKDLKAEELKKREQFEKDEAVKVACLMNWAAYAAHDMSQKHFTVNGSILTRKELFQKVIELDPKNVLAYMNLAEELGKGEIVKLSDGTEATKIELFLKVIELEPKNSAAYRNLRKEFGKGETVKLKDGTEVKIQDLLLKMIEQEPKNAFAYLNLALILASGEKIKLLNGKEMTRQEIFLKCLELDPKCCDSFDFKWPANLDDLKISLEVKHILLSTVVDRLLEENKSIPDVLSLTKSPITIKSQNKNIPTLIFSQNAVIIFLKNVTPLKGGGQRSTMKLGWELLKGKFVIKKEITQVESSIYSQIFDKQKKGKTPGIPKVIFLRNVNKNNQLKRQVFERKYEGDLSKLFRDNITQGRSQKIKIDDCLDQVKNLVEGLKILHQLEIQSGIWKYPCFHGDLTFKNIVYKRNKIGIIRYKIIDYDMADINRFEGTPGWESPENWKFKNAVHIHPHEVHQFNNLYGQKRDLWGLGLVLGSIVRGALQTVKFETKLPCFDFIYNHFKVIGTNQSSICDTSAMTQAEVDHEIEKVKKAVTFHIAMGYTDFFLQSKWDNFWDNLKHLLQVDPNQRKLI